MSTLKRAVFTGSLWTLLGNGGQQLFAFLFFLYLAYMLGPTEFGVMALAAVFIDLLCLAGKLGQVETLQKREVLTERTASTDFWLLQGTGLLLMLGLIAAAPTLGRLFNMPQLVEVLYLLAPICLIQTLGAVHEGWLKRKFGFKNLAYRSLVSTLVSGAVAVALAHNGLGIYALVVQRVLAALLLTGMLWWGYRWLPKFEFDVRDAKGLLRDGINIMAASILGVLNPRIVDLVIGYFMGAYWLGFMRMAWRIFDFVTQFAVQPVVNVALTSFSRLQKDPAALARAYLRLTQLVSLAVLPLFGGLALVAPDVLYLAFGDKWLRSADMVQLLSLISLAAPVNYFFASTMITLGQSRVVLRQGVAQTFLTLAFTVIGAQISVTAVLLLHVLRAYIICGYNLRALKVHLGLPYRAVFNRMLPPFAALGGMMLVVAAIQHVWPVALVSGERLEIALRLAACATAGAAAYVLGLLAGDHLKVWPGYTRDLLKTGREVLKRGSEPDASASVTPVTDQSDKTPVSA